MPIKLQVVDWVRTRGLGLPLIREAWLRYDRHRLHREYEKRREHYSDQARRGGLTYHEPTEINRVRARLADRGYSAKKRKPGEIHTFACVPIGGGGAESYRMAWQRDLLADLRELGPVSHFNYGAEGYRWQEFRYDGAGGLRRRDEMNASFIDSLRRAHRERPVDWLFAYASGIELTPATLRKITEEIGIPSVCMCLDDKQMFDGGLLGGYRSGMADIGREFDIAWTSARVACEWYLVEGGRPLYIPGGGDVTHYHPIPVEQDIPVSFIGAGYGFRKSVVRFLRAHDVPIETYGASWGTRFLSAEEQIQVINRSIINLGMGGIRASEELTNVKGRDFEIPLVGGGVYLTTFNPDLAQHFRIGEEILCYRNRDEMLELIRYYMAHPDEAREIARRGRQRCLAEHRWLHRYQKLCRIFGILPEQEEDKPADPAPRTSLSG